MVVVDLTLLRPVWHPSTVDGDDPASAFDATVDNDRALFETLDEIYETMNVHKALVVTRTNTDAHVLCDYLASRHHAYGYFDRGPEDAAGDITLERFEAGETRVLVTTRDGWWNTTEVVCRHVMYECDLIVYVGEDDGEAMDLRAWVESVCERFSNRVRSPMRFLAASPALFGWNVMWNPERTAPEVMRAT